jgi:threonine synthase
MTTIRDSNVHNIAVKATFDDCQDIVKSLFADKAFNEKYHLGAVNSINWARILAQMVYYFLAYFHVKKQLEKIDSDATIQFVVPTGNFGDVLAGWYTKRMGLPAERLVVATNSNDILARFWTSGRYEKHPASTSTVTGGVLETLSPAMDILVSSNFERLLWYLAYDSLTGSLFSDDAERRRVACKTVKGWMDNVKADGRAVVSEEVLALARKDFVAEKVDDVQVRVSAYVGAGSEATN